MASCARPLLLTGACSIGCNNHAHLRQVAEAARSPASTLIASPAASWLDDFLGWVSPEVGQCCRRFPGDDGGGYCPPPDQPPCAVNATACEGCSTCFRAAGAPGPDLLINGRPDTAQVRSCEVADSVSLSCQLAQN